jgi:hypothetical protein
MSSQIWFQLHQLKTNLRVQLHPQPEKIQFSLSWEAHNPMQIRQISSQVPKILCQAKNLV